MEDNIYHKDKKKVMGNNSTAETFLGSENCLGI